MLKRGMGSASQNVPLKIVSIGGGNGLSTLLRGLKRYVKAGEGILDITAVVTVTDDGGSWGGCGAISPCCRRAISAIAWWLYRKMKRCSAGSFNTVLQAAAG